MQASRGKETFAKTSSEDLKVVEVLERTIQPGLPNPPEDILVALGEANLGIAFPSL
jgi:hypothetical protein